MNEKVGIPYVFVCGFGKLIVTHYGFKAYVHLDP